MAHTEEAGFNSLADRIAALNQQPNFSAPPPAPTARRRAPPPPLPPPPAGRTCAVPSNPSPTAPPRPQTSAPVAGNRLDAPAALPKANHGNGAPRVPARKPSRGPQADSPPSLSPPALPSRRPSVQHLPARRGSSSSEVSHLSNFSSLSVSATSASSAGTPPRKLPPAFDQAKLPPLPPTRRELEARNKVGADTATRKEPAPPPALPKRHPSPRPRASLPPTLPSRLSRCSVPAEKEAPPLPNRRLPPPPKAWNRCGADEHPPPVSNQSSSEIVPPPVPKNSRPSFARVEKAASVLARPTVAQAVGSTNQRDGCLVCRDFSGPDKVAAQYPRNSLPRNDPVAFLAAVLCDPFPSPTDKARAIFTWCHHNIAYDCTAFFSKKSTSATADDVISSGLAVCSGYSKVYLNIAKRAGLDCIDINGHGKGYGYEPLKPGDALPPMDSNHAWNAVRIDGGEWKLLDACWGAGHVTTERTYRKQFSPEQFTRSNETFGWRHFPKNSNHFFLPNSETRTWEQYMWGPEKYLGVEQSGWYSTAAEEGLDKHNYEPYGKHISVYSAAEPTVRFQFGKLCPHWKSEVHGRGKPYLWMLESHGVDGSGPVKMLHLHQNDAWYWIDVPRRELGSPGQKIRLLALLSLNGRDGRGITRYEWDNKGCGSWNFACLADWELVR